jgi:hypothetical protein
MQRAFRALVLVAASGLSPSACIDLEPPPSTSGTVSDDGSPTAGVDETGCEGEACAHGLSGELMLFVNGRLSSADALYQNNLPLSEPGTYIGPSLWLYDPVRTCDDGGSECRLAELGHLRLDETLGALSVGDGSLAKFTLRELAWSPDAGLVAITFDVKNDEWGLARLHVDDWTAIDNEIGVERYTIVPGDAASPSTDPCYWQEGVSGLEFLEGELFLGVRGMGGSGIPSNGAVFRIALDVLDQGHCVYENDCSGWCGRRATRSCRSIARSSIASWPRRRARRSPWPCPRASWPRASCRASTSTGSRGSGACSTASTCSARSTGSTRTRAP